MTDLEIGDIVEDREEDPDNQGQAAVINLPSVSADDWRAYEDEYGEPVTVAADNPGYPADDDVAVVLFLCALERAHGDWAGNEPIPLTDVGPKFYSFPSSRLVVVGEVEGPDLEEPENVPEELQAIADRLEAGGMAVRDVDPDAGIIHASKMGENYTITADGTVDGGALADRVENAIREVEA